MNLPIFNQLQSGQSNYINFSKSLTDLDYAQTNGSEYYLSKFVALKLPVFKVDELFIEMSSITNSTNPNYLTPKAFQYYTENIIRQQIDCPEITEIAFWKTLMRFGLTEQKIKDSVVFANNIVNAAFHRTDNNDGWSEIMCIIPNNCDKLTPAWKSINTLPTTGPYTGDYLTDESYFDDNANKTFDFTTFNEVMDFSNFNYDNSADTNVEFDFNMTLLFYKDKDGVEKLHGINFINPWQNENTHYALPLYNQKTNDYKNIGYQFKFNLKTVNNEATQQIIETVNFNTNNFWASFNSQIGKMNELLSRFNDTPNLNQ